MTQDGSFGTAASFVSAIRSSVLGDLDIEYFNGKLVGIFLNLMIDNEFAQQEGFDIEQIPCTIPEHLIDSDIHARMTWNCDHGHYGPDFNRESWDA